MTDDHEHERHDVQGERGHPPWCAIREEHDHRHESTAREIAGTLLSVADWAPGAPSVAVPRELVALLHTAADETWIYVGDGTDQHLDLSIESWRRVIGAVQGLLLAQAPDITHPVGPHPDRSQANETHGDHA